MPNQLIRNAGCELDLAWLKKAHLNSSAILTKADKISDRTNTEPAHCAVLLLKAITCIDLTTLAGDDTFGNVSRLCFKAARPIPEDVLKKFGFSYETDCLVKTASVCVYPSRVPDANVVMKGMRCSEKINIASVATGFPCGQTPLEARLAEIKYAVENGANEIDIVINRTLVLSGQWKLLYSELQQMKEACGSAHMKSILAVGELGTFQNVYKASLVAMMAGSDFIKTSTGKEAVNATLPFGIVMCRAIRDYYDKTGYKVGLKPAGGIKTSKDVLNWFLLIKEELGNEWLSPHLFRFGASGLLSDIEHRLYEFLTKKIPKPYTFTM